MKNIFISSISVVLLSSVALSQQTTPQKSLYKDPTTGHYFSNGNSRFNLKPMGQQKHLERIELSINDGPFTNYNGEIVLNNEGPHEIKFRATDPVLNWSPVQTVRIFVDKTSPKSRWSWDGPQVQKDGKVYVSPKTKLVLTAEDSLSGVAGIWTKKTDQEQAWKAPATFPPGEHHMQFYSRDNVGNQSEVTTLTFVVDDKMPETKYDLQGQLHSVGSKTYMNLGSKIELKSEDAHSGVQYIEYMLNSQHPQKFSSPITFSSSPSVLRYRAVDHIGNEEPWKEVTLYQDTSAPQVKFNKAGHYEVMGGKVFAKAGFQINIEAFDQESGIKEFKVLSKVDGVKKVSEKTYVFENPGEYSFELQAVDNVGNRSDVSPMQIVVDDKSPVSKLEPMQNFVEREGVKLSAVPNQLKISSEDNGVGVQTIEYSYDGKSFVPYKGPIDLATWSDTKQTVYYRAVDRLGNTEPVQSLTIQILKQAPVVGLFVEGDQQALNVPLSETMKTRTQATAPTERAEPAATRQPASVPAAPVKPKK